MNPRRTRKPRKPRRANPNCDAPKRLNSNREGHLFAAIVSGVLVTGLGMAAVILEPDLNLGWFAISGLLIPVWEWGCSMDFDHSRRKVFTQNQESPVWVVWKAYWAPYKWTIHHRSQLSHSLLLGTPARIAYLLWPLLLWQVFQMGLGGAVAAFNRAVFYTSVEWLTAFMLDPRSTLQALGAAWESLGGWRSPITAAVIGDIIHLCKDGYSPKYWLLGK